MGSRGSHPAGVTDTGAWGIRRQRPGPRAPAAQLRVPGGSELPPPAPSLSAFGCKRQLPGRGHGRLVLPHLLGAPSAARPTSLPAQAVSLEGRALLWEVPGPGTSLWGPSRPPPLPGGGQCPPVHQVPRHGRCPQLRTDTPLVRATEPSFDHYDEVKNQAVRVLRSVSYRSPNASVFLLEYSISRFCLTNCTPTHSPEVSTCRDVSLAENGPQFQLLALCGVQLCVF